MKFWGFLLVQLPIKSRRLSGNSLSNTILMFVEDYIHFGRTSLGIFKKNSGTGRQVLLHKESGRAYGRDWRKLGRNLLNS
ncbi:hypothetical protein LOK49_LG05G01329 [Camellia lanceoleosa]|uniref:Uncharacterized protein n=1 Tax=Camellia lanceoleosa TaxID=1840588 RepID=A0ACC0HJU4_9ERIC|nr:hypothetical protein LOK49_LG05G01329 [Camellia lanceoleosa]